MNNKHHYNCRKCKNWQLREDGKTYGCRFIDEGHYPIITIPPKSNRFPNHMVCEEFKPRTTAVTVSREAVRNHIWMAMAFQCSSCRELMGAKNIDTCPHCGAAFKKEVQ